MGAILVAMLLAIGSVQCVASCAGDECAAKNPPCHHTESTVQACSHELVADRANPVAPPAPALIFEFVRLVPIAVSTDFSTWPDPGPAPPLIPLRI